MNTAKQVLRMGNRSEQDKVLFHTSTACTVDFNDQDMLFTFTDGSQIRLEDGEMFEIESAAQTTSLQPAKSGDSMYKVTLIGTYCTAVVAKTASIDKALRLQTSILRNRSRWPVGALACVVGVVDNGNQ